jgi:hypothetical protein
MASTRQCLLNQFADLSVCANQNNLHKNSVLVSDLRIYLFTFNLGGESPRELADADLLASALPNNFAVLTTGELMPCFRFRLCFVSISIKFGAGQTRVKWFIYLSV